jgi:hypothetical protein
MIGMVRSVEESIIEGMRSLPPEKRLEVLDFARFLATQAANDQAAPQESIFDFVARLPAGTRSKEDIDTQIKDERASWGER